MNTGYSKVAEPPGETELGSRVSGGHRPRKRWTWAPPLRIKTKPGLIFWEPSSVSPAWMPSLPDNLTSLWRVPRQHAQPPTQRA